jgi:hypothetical protein
MGLGSEQEDDIVYGISTLQMILLIALGLVALAALIISTQCKCHWKWLGKMRWWRSGHRYEEVVDLDDSRTTPRSFQGDLKSRRLHAHLPVALGGVVDFKA